MIIGACAVRLHLPGALSLKEKRGRIKPILARLPKEFNLAAAEIDLQDVWQTAEIGLVTVSNDAGLAQSLLEKSVRWIEHNAPDVEVEDYRIEIR
ncbi:MAG: DUF503 domain-containing protein [Chloroflexi bacterium]|nr:DUF503 domain-containing protein [Chloroflexota bacterium]